jgi:hypothetical protein
LTTKFDRLAGAHLAAGRVNALREACWGCSEIDSVRRLVALLGPPPNKAFNAKEKKSHIIPIALNRRVCLLSGEQPSKGHLKLLWPLGAQ